MSAIDDVWARASDKIDYHRAILLVDDDRDLMHKYHNWMSVLSRVYSRAHHYSSMHRLYDRRVFDISDLDSTLDCIKGSYKTGLDLVITDFDLITATGNDVARIVRAKFPHTRIVGNTGGDPSRFDKTLVDFAVDKIMDSDTFYSVIKKNTTIVRDTGIIDLFDRVNVYR
jgi:hypothetical protein